MTKYRTIVADPPWAYPGGWPGWSNIECRSALPYPSMTVEQIAALPVRSLLDKEGYVFVWTTNQYLEECYRVVRAWGCTPRTTIVWCKEPRGKGPGGMFAITTEFVVIGQRIADELGRSREAVHTRASTLGIRWQKPTPGRNHSGFTAQGVAHILGLRCSKAVAEWIKKGYLSGSRRAPRMDSGPRLAYRVYPESLRVFLRDYPWLYDWRRVQDRGWRAYVESLPREEWIGTRAAADLLFMTKEGVALAIRKGDVRAEKVGANWVIPMSAIRAYVPPPFGGKRVGDELAARRARNLAAIKSRTYTQRPETVAKAEASRRARRQRTAA